MNRGKLGAIAVLGVVLAALFFAPGKSAEPEVTSRLDVMTACDVAVSRRLVSPGSMNRVNWSEPTLEAGRWRYVVEVDSQNAMGGLLRSRWGCSVDHNTGQVTDLRQLD